MAREPMIFDYDNDDLTPVEDEVKYKGKTYYLREADEGAAIAHRNTVMKGTKFGPDGKPERCEGIAGAEVQLVASCLFEKYKHSNGEDKERNPTVQEILKWPARIVKPVFKRICEISNLKESDELDEDGLAESITTMQKRLADMKAGKDPAKNEPSATTDTSA